MGCGALYVVLGMLCFKWLRERQIGALKRKKWMKSQVTHLTAQREEIEKLLTDTESKLDRL